MAPTCKEGHELEEQKLGKMQGWVHTRDCEYCQSTIHRGEIRYHCPDCEVDVCAGCAASDQSGPAQSPELPDASSQTAVPPSSLPSLTGAGATSGYADDGGSQLLAHGQDLASVCPLLLPHGFQGLSCGEKPRLAGTAIAGPDALQAESQLVTMQFSGKMGVVYNFENGVIDQVLEGQARKHGVQAGWQMLYVDDLPYSEATLEQKKSSQKPYRLTCLKQAGAPSLGFAFANGQNPYMPPCPNGHCLSQKVRCVPGSNTCNRCGRPGIVPPEPFFQMRPM